MNPHRIPPLKQRIPLIKPSREQKFEEIRLRRTLGVKLEIHNNNFEEIGLLGMIKSLKHMGKSLHCLDIDLTDIENENSIQIKVLGKYVRSLSCLRKIKISPKGNSRNDYFKLWSKNLKPLKKLNNFFLDLFRCQLFSDNNLVHLKKNLKCIKTLNNLSLKVWSFFKLTEKDIGYENINLSCLDTINSLSLDFAFHSHYFEDDGDVEDAYLVSLSEGLKPLKRLNYLSLNLLELRGISAKELAVLFQIIKSMNKLSSLSVDFHYCQYITDKVVLELNKTLQSLDQLTNLSLDFTSCQGFTDNALTELGKNLNSLNTFELNLIHCKVTDNGLISLGENLKVLKTLQKLSLHLNSKEITDKSKNFIRDNLKQCFISTADYKKQ